ncbi:MAG TPA: sugar phosphate nucleotidyltransferase [Anaerolineales bacterium]|nr:sugar phosphate nucleotidyltransferase [Anaerolineales bacterium]
MRVVIPMAGFGTRLRPHTWTRPKPLLTVAGKPVLGHVLDTFADLPFIDEVVFVVGYLGEQIEAYVSRAYPHLKARYVEQKDMLGQSHAIWLARETLRGPMLMIFVDTLIEADLARLAEDPSQAVAFVKPVPDPRRFGVADVGADGWVQRLAEKPEDTTNNLAVVGLYYFREAADLVAAIEEQMSRGAQLKGEYYLTDAINVMLEHGLKMRVETVPVWMDCGKPEALLETNRYLLDHGRDNSAEVARRPDVVVLPPVYVDPSAEVRHTVLGPHLTIGAGCVVERSVLRDSIIDDGSHILDTMLTGSLIGREARVAGRYRSLNVGDSSEVDFG